MARVDLVVTVADHEQRREADEARQFQRGVVGLLSQMCDPRKVLGFLDISSNWNPSLALVIGGASAVGLPMLAIAKRRTRSFLDEPGLQPTARRIDRRQVIGSLLFGVEWGIAGLCLGAALVTLGVGVLKGVLFVVARLAGMWVYEGRQSRH